MSRPPAPCSACARFVPTEAGTGQCTGYEKPRQADDTNEACPLFKRAKDEAQHRAWAEKQETISRASASQR